MQINMKYFYYEHTSAIPMFCRSRSSSSIAILAPLLPAALRTEDMYLAWAEKQGLREKRDTLEKDLLAVCVRASAMVLLWEGGGVQGGRSGVCGTFLRFVRFLFVVCPGSGLWQLRCAQTHRYTTTMLGFIPTRSEGMSRFCRPERVRSGLDFSQPWIFHIGFTIIGIIDTEQGINQLTPALLEVGSVVGGGVDFFFVAREQVCATKCGGEGPNPEFYPPPGW